MLKRNLKCVDLPKLQKKIVLCFAEFGAMNITDTNKKINGHESATNLAIHKLKLKKMIEEVETYKYREREFSKYWLTNKGIASALLNDSNPEKTKNNALKFSKDKTIEVYFELHSISPKIADILDLSMLFNDIKSPEELIKIIALEVISLGQTEIKKFLDTTKKYKEFDNAWKQISQNMRKINGSI